MNTSTARPFDDVIPPELAADTQAVIDHLMTGKPLDPVVARRIRERGDLIREKIFREHGVLDIGVPAIRELRDS
jgi:hypothetical protein